MGVNRYGYAAVIELLLKRGADAKCKDADGKTPGDVMGTDLNEDSRVLVDALFVEHAKRAKTGRQRRGSCSNIPPAVSIATLDTTTSLAAAAAAGRAPERTTPSNGGNKDSAGQANLPLPSLTTPQQRGAVERDHAIDGSILSGLSGGDDATNGAAGSAGREIGVVTAAADGGADGSSPATTRRAQHRRGSYSAAAHIRVSTELSHFVSFLSW